MACLKMPRHSVHIHGFWNDRVEGQSTLNLRQVLRERPEDAAAACDLGVPKSLAALLSRASGETGEAALALLAALADDAAACERLRQARHARGTLQNLSLGTILSARVSYK